MKAVLYKRSIRGIHWSAGAYADMIYLPQNKLLFFVEQLGSFGNRSYGMSVDEVLLAEAELALVAAYSDKTDMQLAGCDGELTNIRLSEMDDVVTACLANNIRERDAIESRIRNVIKTTIGLKE